MDDFDYFDFDGDGHLNCVELAIGYELLFGDEDEADTCAESEWDEK